ncbi:mechanosensitive ion channel protein MscS [Chryseobacterium sp. Leaf404]|uniref:mechanosensitive ion channel family protein n=1 Tax=unclassified Chryseobacterium TaxID=2593645 RepID=UPI0006F7B002|nr:MULTISPECIES: mechanosensitive ion channel family protein [unclassified Chryseobacterium]KQT16391.1 mechanosensitive ion channel protein MscS [Chryseobacterium sp. Leaf404]
MEFNPHGYIDTITKVLENWYVAFAQLTPKLIVGAIVFSFFLLTSKYLSKLAVKLFHKFFPKSTAEASITTTISVFRFVILIIGTFITLEIIGFSSFLWKFIGSLGVAGVIAGVALKDLVSSIFSGMLIGVDKAFKVGDYITIGNHSGTVMDIGLLTTKMITDDGKKVFIPNQVIFNAPFYNITASPQRRIIFNFEIPADEDISKAKKGILEIISNTEELDRPENVDVVYTDLKQGVFNLQVRFWMKVGSNMLLVKNDVLTKIKDRFDADGVHLVTPTSIQISGANSELPQLSNES